MTADCKFVISDNDNDPGPIEVMSDVGVCADCRLRPDGVDWYSMNANVCDRAEAYADCDWINRFDSRSLPIAIVHRSKYVI